MALLCLALLATAQPAYAAGDPTVPAPGDLGSVMSEEDQVRQEMANASQEITDLNLRIAGLERSIAATDVRISQERGEARVLARLIYSQPDSALGYLAQSRSLADALTRAADLSSAGERATSTKKALVRDLAAFRTQSDQLQVQRARQEALKARLEAAFAKLVVQAVAIRAAEAPPPPPAPPVATRVDPANVGPMQDLIRQAFAPLGAGAQAWALRIARCESQYNPYAVNRSSGAAGLFQFLATTWAGTPQHASSPFDPTANSQAAAWLYQKYGAGQWSCR